MLTQWLEMKARGCCRHVFLVLLGQHLLCLDIDECLSLPCGPKENNKCTNFQGSYECTVCDDGYFPEAILKGKCIGM